MELLQYFWKQAVKFSPIWIDFYFLGYGRKKGIRYKA